MWAQALVLPPLWDWTSPGFLIGFGHSVYEVDTGNEDCGGSLCSYHLLLGSETQL